MAQSSILSALGLSSDPVQAELGKINQQLNTINNSLNNIQSQLTTLLGDFNTLYQQELKNAIDSDQNLITYLTNNVGTYFNDYLSAVENALPAGSPKSDLTFQMVANSTDAVATFAKNFPGSTDGPISKLHVNVTTLFSDITKSTGLLVNLNQKVAAQVQESNYGLNSLNLVSTLNGYNESLMNVYSNLIQALQMAYTIQSTFLYLAGTETSSSYFKYWVFPIAGIDNSQDYATNQGILNAWYQTHFQNAFNFVAQYLISDSYDTVTAAAGALGGQTEITYQTGYTPMQAKTLSGMRPDNNGFFSNAAPWTHACDIYVWKGVSSNSFESGAYGSSMMTARCNAGGTQQVISLALEAADTTATPINFYYGPARPGENLAWLQPQQWNANFLTTLLDPTDFDESYGYAQTKPSTFDCGSIILSDQAWNPFPQAKTIVPIASAGFTLSAGAYVTPDGDGRGGDYQGWIIEEFISPLGLVSWFWIGAEYVSVGWDDPKLSYQLQCGGNGQTNGLCSQGQGFVASNGAYVSYACIGGYQVQIYSMGTDGNDVWLSIGDTRNCM